MNIGLILTPRRYACRMVPPSHHRSHKIESCVCTFCCALQFYDFLTPHLYRTVNAGCFSRIDVTQVVITFVRIISCLIPVIYTQQDSDNVLILAVGKSKLADVAGTMAACTQHRAAGSQVFHRGVQAVGKLGWVWKAIGADAGCNAVADTGDGAAIEDGFVDIDVADTVAVEIREVIDHRIVAGVSGVHPHTSEIYRILRNRYDAFERAIAGACIGDTGYICLRTVVEGIAETGVGCRCLTVGECKVVIVRDIYHIAVQPISIR